MNKLQLSLLAIGALVIIAVLAFNRWQERKYRRQAEQRFQSRHEDVLLSDKPAVRTEPVLDALADQEPWNESEPVPVQPVDEDVPAPEAERESEPEPEMGEPAPVATLAEPEPEPSIPQPAVQAPERQPEAVPVRPREAQTEPDPVSEFIVAIDAVDPVSAHALVAVLQQVQPVGKAVRWLGQCSRQYTWGDVMRDAPDTEYVKLAACLQLADRNGAVRPEELNQFCDLVQAVAANLYAVVDCPDKQAALAAAAELDQFCADVDVLIGINVIAKDGSTFPGTKLRGLAESAGMKLMADSQFHYLNDQGAELFALCNLDPAPFEPDTMKHLSTHGVTFLFDLPKATGGVQAFNQMMLAVKQFAAPLGALVVDDNRRELTAAGIDRIRQQLQAIYEKMERHGTPPGSPRARRLFA